ncbi:hypothetical protein AKJ08_2166 [Vulgatibacter incomptus]|uniref:Uncharacterized protein n=1 Tax=Vulgatibacter incomptus TaxID=1391653 RepID=A0A0K1PF97_9BACT|nr:hypothetical protein AKJ08_2166 [Vulgatibacter incomptus]
MSEALTTRSDHLSSEEERVIRGLRGIPAARGTRLEAKASGTMLDELHVMELEIRRRYQAHLARPQPQASAAKDSLIRALREKK